MATQDQHRFGQALKAALEGAEMTQAKLARTLGIDAGQVSRWATGRSLPVRHTAARIGEILGVDLTEAFQSSIPTVELYVSAPITGLGRKAITAHHSHVAQVVEVLEEHVNSLHWPGRDITGTGDLLAPDIATERNMTVLSHCLALLYLQFEPVVRPSGALVELGIALGRRMKTTIIVKRDLPQPFMLQEFAAVAARVDSLPQARVYLVDDVDAARQFIDRNGRELLGLA